MTSPRKERQAEFVHLAEVCITRADGLQLLERVRAGIELILDFSGVSYLSPAFMVGLLFGITPDELRRLRAIGQSDLSRELMLWVFNHRFKGLTSPAFFRVVRNVNGIDAPVIRSRSGVLDVWMSLTVCQLSEESYKVEEVTAEEYEHLAIQRVAGIQKYSAEQLARSAPLRCHCGKSGFASIVSFRKHAKNCSKNL